MKVLRKKARCQNKSFQPTRNNERIIISLKIDLFIIQLMRMMRKLLAIKKATRNQ